MDNQPDTFQPVTSNPITCSYSWNTTNVSLGDYYLDVNVTNSYGNSIQASSNQFQVVAVSDGNCSDGIKNGNELGIDCDGRCSQTCQQEYGLCVPIIKNGDSDEKIDVVFVGSGFPDLNKFSEVVDEMIDYNGNGHGLMSEYPFSQYKNSFNFWKINYALQFSLSDCQLAQDLLAIRQFIDRLLQHTYSSGKNICKIAVPVEEVVHFHGPLI